ncbi:MAG TPA: prepilin-type N-terminal cleavage/methylation domain-containing protein [Pyrinomonadaceae bacterium]
MCNDRHRQSIASAQQGFTLLEAAIALVILMIIGLGIASLFTYALGANTRADDRELAMTIAQKRMESLRTVPFTTQTRMLDISVGGLKATLPEGVTETVESAGRSFTVNTQIQDISVVPLGEPDAGAPTSKSIRVAVTPVAATTGFETVILNTQRSTQVVGVN